MTSRSDGRVPTPRPRAPRGGIVLPLLVLAGAVAACRSPRGGGDKRGRDKAAEAASTATSTAGPAPPSLPTPRGSTLARSADGATVYDRTRDVTWLADANLPAKLPLGVKGIHPSGSMDYKTALRWVAALNAAEGGAGYLGRKDWSLPPTLPDDATCSSRNRYAFGTGCTKSLLADLYTRGLGLTYPTPAVAVAPTTVKGFSNFRPYLYWSESANANHPENENGYTTFSFANGFQGSNVSRNFIYAIPMIRGRVTGGKVAGKTVYDPAADVTWLADANLAASQTFGVRGIAPSGAMSHATALEWVAAMNRAEGGRGYLGEKRWQLPPTVEADPSCSVKQTFGSGCKGSPLGSLYYNVLGLATGEPVVKAIAAGAGPFVDLQPYLYWSCHAAADGRGCHADSDLPVRGFGWSFSFGNGFQGTTTYGNDLYVLVQHPGPHGPAVKGRAP